MKRSTKLLLGAAIILVVLAQKRQPAPVLPPAIDNEASPVSNPVQAAALEGYRHRKRTKRGYRTYPETV